MSNVTTGNPALLIDGYKLSHRDQYPQGTKLVYGNFTPRGDRLFNSPIKDGSMIWYGAQIFIQTFLVKAFNEQFFNLSEEEAVLPFQKEVEMYLGTSYDVEHLRALHRLGYLPLEIKSLDEGSLVPMKVPVLTIVNTVPEFFWLVNYLETLMSAELWKPATAATTAFHYRKILKEFSDRTCDDESHLPFQAHDFSARGLSGSWDAATTGSAHLTSFLGTDSVNAIPLVREIYGDEGFLAGSIPATEHSVACANIALEVAKLMKKVYPGGSIPDEDTLRGMAEKAFLKRMLTEIYPSGLFSYVGDTFDFWRLISEIAKELKEDIEAREGKVVFRPDSGVPEDIICGTSRELGAETVEEAGAIEVLWNIFGGTVNSKGFKVLNPKVGLIYGDSITLVRATEILKRLEEKGFASSNVVFGVGSFTYQYVTRDTFGFAMKATYIEVEGVDAGIDLCKDPKTGDGGKKSAKGLLRVDEVDGKLVLSDEQTREQEKGGKLITRFKDSKVYNKQSMSEIRSLVASH